MRRGTATLVEVREAVRAGRHVRPQGQDFAAGDEVLPAGRRLGARDVGLAAAANRPWLAVHRRPRVALLATGDEIALPGEDVPSGGIVSSNTHALAALVRASGGEPLLLPIARDDRDSAGRRGAGARGADLLVTTGGASVGDYDLVQAALGDEGFQLDFWKVAMRPGKPLVSGHLGAMPVLGLPGNPVSALVCGLLFLVPAIARLSGLPGDAPARVEGAARRARSRPMTGAPTTSGPACGTSGTAPWSRRRFHARTRRCCGPSPRRMALILRSPNAPALPAGARRSRCFGSTR